MSRLYERCPKCGHAPLPADQSLPAACPRCGIVLAKFKAVVERRNLEIRGGLEAEPETASRLARLLAPFAYVPSQVLRMNWYLRVAGLAILGVLTLMVATRYHVPTGEGGLWLASAFLVPFHEFGHIAFMPLGEFMTLLGGTIGQHAVALGLGALFLYRQRDPYAASLMFWLFGYSVLGMATYMYDAQLPQLTLLTGRTGDTGAHDWVDMFGDLGLLDRARSIGSFFGWIGRSLLFAALAWCAWIVMRQHARLSDNALAEEDRPPD